MNANITVVTFRHSSHARILVVMVLWTTSLRFAKINAICT